MFKRIIFAGLTAGLLIGCGSSEKEEENQVVLDAREIIAEVSQEFVADKRVALFNVEAEEREGNLLIKGESNLPEAVEKLKAKLGEKSIVYTDSIDVLPGKILENASNALVKISVANLRSNPAHSAELATQATLGTPLKVLKASGEWFLIQTPDKYISWVDHGGLQTISDAEFEAWKNSEKIIFTEPFGFAYEEASDKSQVISDLVAGSILEMQDQQNGFYKVKYPDGAIAFVRTNSAKPYNEWLAEAEPSGENLIKTSKSLMGLPYLWGGTSAKGVDCSGYTKTVFFMNGLVIPRDASQQVHTGKLIDSTRNFQNLIPGDLLFFGRPATDSTSEKVVHVGMWIGNNQFIHSSGRVRVSSVDSTAKDFDDFNYKRYLKTKRLTGQEDPAIIKLNQSELFGRRGQAGE